MKQLIISLIFFFFFASFSEIFGQTQSQSQRQFKSFSLEGNMEDWPDTLYKDSKTQWIYAISNDSKNLYLSLEISDTKAQQQILLTGMTVWISPEGKKKNKRGVSFPLGIPEEDQPNDPFRLREVLPEIDASKSYRVQQFNSLELINFYGKQERTWGNHLNPGGINTHLAVNEDGVFIYEGIFPLEAFPNWEFRENPKKQVFNLAIETGILGRPQIQGTDGVGMGGGGISSPSQAGGQFSRNYQDLLANYRQFTVPVAIKLKKVKLTF